MQINRGTGRIVISRFEFPVGHPINFDHSSKVHYELFFYLIPNLSTERTKDCKIPVLKFYIVENQLNISENDLVLIISYVLMTCFIL